MFEFLWLCVVSVVSMFVISAGIAIAAVFVSWFLRTFKFVFWG